ncbi:hypothetical protein BJQ94_05385 [Cryobacterium sp. SO2]|uniref:hypothetical protein n=1 Tax=Cryobacterium sp. SO2 TaxID=1897060 RepID=UPI00223D9684|nr:hypothetical protein [Cryobacterium sp. SO2]WEO78470.1 hypothetical protein BJQ94_05385 [Cryobacterium sp. SO2]
MLALAGCAGASPGTGSTADPVASATPTTDPSSTPVAACPESDSQGPWGDVIAAAQVTDAAGSYCRTAIDPAAVPFDDAVVDLDSLTTYGFTIDDARAAQQVAVAYVAEQGLDSTRLDDYSVTDSAWFDTAKDAFSPAAQARFAPLVESDGLRDTGVIVTQSLPTPLARDGGPRAGSTDIQVDKIFATLDVDQVTPLLVVRVPFRAAYPATDATIVDTAIRDERGTATLTEDTLRTTAPSLFDGSDEEGLLLTGSFNVGFGTGEMTAIAYIGAAWTLATGDGALQIDTVQPEVDPSQR